MDIVEQVLAHAGAQKYMVGCCPPNSDDLHRIVSLLNLTKPKGILELGSGWSTLVMARWIMDNPGSFLEALESDPVYYKATMGSLYAIDDIVERFVDGQMMARQIRYTEWEHFERYRVLISPVVNGQWPDSVAFAYQCLTQPDFVYVDGPAVWGKRVITENPITAVDHNRPMVFYVDGRSGCAQRIYESYRLRLNQPYEWLYCPDENCSLVYHETFAGAGEWFAENHACLRASAESES